MAEIFNFVLNFRVSDPEDDKKLVDMWISSQDLPKNAKYKRVTNPFLRETTSSRIEFLQTFPVYLMNEEMEPMIVIQKEGSIYFKDFENENETDPIQSNLKFISPLRADFEFNEDQDSKVNLYIDIGISLYKRILI